MSQFETALNSLKRPQLLIDAARLGARRFRRKRHLRSISPNASGLDRSALLRDLIEKEHDQDWNRRSGSTDYNVQRHVLLLSALIFEAKNEVIAIPHANASGSEAFFS